CDSVKIRPAKKHNIINIPISIKPTSVKFFIYFFQYLVEKHLSDNSCIGRSLRNTDPVSMMQLFHQLIIVFGQKNKDIFRFLIQYPLKRSVYRKKINMIVKAFKIQIKDFIISHKRHFDKCTDMFNKFPP